MNLKTRYNLWQTKRKLSPGAKFKAILWKNLSVAWNDRYQTNYFWYQRPTFKWATAGVLTVLVATSFGTGVYAYNNPEVTEGTAFYPIKQALEQVEEAATVTPEGKAKLYLKKIQQREAEKVVMERRHQKVEKVDRRIKLTEDKLEKNNERLEKVKIKDETLKLQVKERLENRLEKQKENLEKRGQNLQNKKERLINKPKNSVLAPKNRRGEGRNGIEENKINN